MTSDNRHQRRGVTLKPVLELSERLIEAVARNGAASYRRRPRRGADEQENYDRGRGLCRLSVPRPAPISKPDRLSRLRLGRISSARENEVIRAEMG